MEFKVGDRVHVTRLDGEKVDFYATLTNFNFDLYGKTADLVNCSNATFEGKSVFLPIYKDFGLDKEDYYTLATDENKINEQDMIKKLIREKRDLLKEIERLEEDNEHLCKLGYETYKELFKYRRLTDNIKNKYKTKPGRYSDLIDLINDMEDK